MGKTGEEDGMRGRSPGMTTTRELRFIPISELRFDPRNPRLPENMDDYSQDGLLTHIAVEYNAIDVAKSIAAHGYFPSEPLIILPDADGWTVLEGNRRLAALKLLSNPEIATQLGIGDDEWDSLIASAQVPDQVPVVIATSRMAVAPIIGYRHISGIEPWDPWAKARFIAHLIDDENLSFEEAANEVGEDKKDVQTHYRNYRIVYQARELFQIPTRRLEQRFGVFTRLMQDKAIQEFLGAPAPRNVKKGKNPLPSTSESNLRKILSWAFGDEQHPPVFTDSRKIADLGRVVSSPEAIKILEITRNLEEAHIAAGGIRDRLITRLSRAKSNLSSAAQDYQHFADDSEVHSLVLECANIIDSMRSDE